METSFSINLRYFMRMFKSYYVVWKLSLFISSSVKPPMFKSYYVVWKPKTETRKNTHAQSLNRTMQYGNFSFFKIPEYGISGFKSYYVVWKLFVVWIYCSAISSLNRTMQYGNGELCSIPNKDNCGLNRTMQYGNFFSISPTTVQLFV